MPDAQNDGFQRKKKVTQLQQKATFCCISVINFDVNIVFARASRTLNVGKEKLYEISGSKWNPCTLGIPGLMRVVLESLL